MIEHLTQICKQLYRELGYRHDRVRGKCARASFALHKKLSEHGIKAHLYVVNDMHCFVTTKADGIEYVLDLTYTQFNSKVQDIIVEPLSEYQKRKAYYDIWRINDTYPDKIRKTNNRRYFRQYLLRNWPLDQKPITR